MIELRRTARPRLSRMLAPALCLAAALAAGCSDEPAGTTAQPPIFDTGADQVMFGVEHYLTRDGIRRGVLHADTALTYEDVSEVEMRGLEIRFFDEAGEDRGVLTAASGRYDLASGDMTVRGDVDLRGRLEAGAPSRLETDSLTYTAGADELTTDAPWTLTHPDGMVERGKGLVTDPALQSISGGDYEVTAPDVAVPE